MCRNDVDRTTPGSHRYIQDNSRPAIKIKFSAGERVILVPMAPRRIGVFGGSFDPPHIGHLILAEEAIHQLQLAQVLWVLTPINPLKNHQPITSLEHRLVMLELATARNPKFEISNLEINRPGPQYTLETLQLLKDQEPESNLILLLGGDSLRDLPNWREPLEILRICHQVGVMRRPGDRVDLSHLESQLPGISEKIAFIDAPLLEIAAREIRQRIKDGAPYQYYLRPSVFDYIRREKLYL